MSVAPEQLFYLKTNTVAKQSSKVYFTSTNNYRLPFQSINSNSNSVDNNINDILNSFSCNDKNRRIAGIIASTAFIGSLSTLNENTTNETVTKTEYNSKSVGNNKNANNNNDTIAENDENLVDDSVVPVSSEFNDLLDLDISYNNDKSVGNTKYTDVFMELDFSANNVSNTNTNIFTNTNKVSENNLWDSPTKSSSDGKVTKTITTSNNSSYTNDAKTPAKSGLKPPMPQTSERKKEVQGIAIGQNSPSSSGTSTMKKLFPEEPVFSDATFGNSDSTITAAEPNSVFASESNTDSSDAFATTKFSGFDMFDSSSTNTISMTYAFDAFADNFATTSAFDSATDTVSETVTIPTVKLLPILTENVFCVQKDNNIEKFDISSTLFFKLGNTVGNSSSTEKTESTTVDNDMDLLILDPELKVKNAIASKYTTDTTPFEVGQRTQTLDFHFKYSYDNKCNEGQESNGKDEVIPAFKFIYSDNFRPLLMKARCLLTPKDAKVLVVVQIIVNPKIKFVINNLSVQVALSMLLTGDNSDNTVAGVVCKHKGNYNDSKKIITWKIDRINNINDKNDVIFDLNNSNGDSGMTAQKITLESVCMFKNPISNNKLPVSALPMILKGNNYDNNAICNLTFECTVNNSKGNSLVFVVDNEEITKETKFEYRFI